MTALTNIDVINMSQAFVDALNEKFPVENPWDYSFGLVIGRRYVKITRVSEGRDRSVFAFVDMKTADLIKPAAWNQPAKLANGKFQSKYNLETQFAEAVEAADGSGGFLYSHR